MLRAHAIILQNDRMLLKNEIFRIG